MTRASCATHRRTPVWILTSIVSLGSRVIGGFARTKACIGGSHALERPHALPRRLVTFRTGEGRLMNLARPPGVGAGRRTVGEEPPKRAVAQTSSLCDTAVGLFPSRSRRRCSGM